MSLTSLLEVRPLHVNLTSPCADWTRPKFITYSSQTSHFILLPGKRFGTAYYFLRYQPDFSSTFPKTFKGTFITIELAIHNQFGRMPAQPTFSTTLTIALQPVLAVDLRMSLVGPIGHFTKTYRICSSSILTVLLRPLMEA